MKQLLLLLSLALAGLGAKGQNTFQERAYRLDSKFKFMSTSDQDRQGNVVMSGLINTGISSGNGDIHNSKVMLFKPNTDTLWSLKGPDVPDFRYNPFVKFRAFGGYSLTTTIKKSLLFPPPPDDYDVIHQNISPSGNLLMNTTFNPNLDNNGIISFLSTPDNGFLINEWEKSGNSPYVISLTRTDSSGTVLWQRNLTRVAPDGLPYMEHAGQGNSILAGTYRPDPISSIDKIKLYLVNTNGDSVRGSLLNITGNTNRKEYMLGNTGQGIISLSDGGFFITGFIDTVHTTPGLPQALGFVARINSSFQVSWRSIFRPNSSMPNGVYFTKAKELKDGSIIVLGQDINVNLGIAVNGFQLYHFNAFGSLMNTYSFTSIQYPSLQVNVLEALPDSSFMIGGRCRTAGNAQTGFYVAKVKIPGLAAGRPSYIMAAPKEVTVATNALGAAYPNPASGQVYIPYQLPLGTRTASVKLTDLTGKEVGSYEIKAEKQGTLQVNIRRLSNGLYLYTLVLDGRPVATKKLSVQH